MIKFIEQELKKDHAGEQIWRFFRLFAFSLVTQTAVLSGGHMTRSLAISTVVSAAETAFRQLYPVATVKRVKQVVQESTPVTTEPPAVQ